MNTETINFDDIPTTDFEVLPEDRYPLECVEAELAESKAGNAKVTVSFKVTSGSYKNRRLWNDFSLVQTAWFNLKNYFEAAGIEVEGEIDFEDLPDMMLGSKVSGYVTQEVYNKKPNNKVSNWATVDASNDGLFD